MTYLSAFSGCLLMLINSGLFAQPGMPDLNFGNAGQVTTAFGNGDDYGQSVAVQPDGKLVVAGFTNNGSQVVFAVARYLPDGRPDSTFSNDGRQTTSFGTGDHRAYAVALQSDGKIVVAGFATVNNEFDFAIARYQPDGALDPTFSGDGKTTTNLGGFFDKAYALVIQPDGKIVVAGNLGQNTNSDFGLVRYHPNGTLDAAFGNGGIATLPIGSSYDELHALALQSDGKIVAAGFTDNGTDYDFALARFTTAGLPDPGFNGTGKQSTPIGNMGDYGQSVVVQPDGGIVLLGYTASTTLDYDFALVRYLPDGSPDNSFGNAGTVVTAITPSFDAGYALALQPDGKIVAGGYAAGNGHPEFAVARYLPNGNPDTGFGLNGITHTDLLTGTDQITALAIGTDGKIVAAGRSNNGTDFDFAVARYLSGLLVDAHDLSKSENPLRLAPNPVCDQAVLTYDVEDETWFSLALYDYSGRLVQTFFDNEKRDEGVHHEVLVFRKSVAAGNYLLLLNSGLGIRKVQVVKVE